MSHIDKILEKFGYDEFFSLIESYQSGIISEGEVALEAIPKDEVAEFYNFAEKVIGKRIPLSKEPSVTQIDFIIIFIKTNKDKVDPNKFRSTFPTIVKNINILIQARKK